MSDDERVGQEAEQRSGYGDMQVERQRGSLVCERERERENLIFDAFVDF